MRFSITPMLFLCICAVGLVTTTQAQQGVVVVPLNEETQAKLEPGDTTSVISRGGFSVQCKLWNGNVCVEPWIGMNAKAITAPTPNCIDQPSKLRPMWDAGDLESQARAFCRIATGSSSYVSFSSDGATSEQAGWNYISNSEPNTSCANPPNYRRYSLVKVPGQPERRWSFDNFSQSRNGRFSTYECNW